MSQSCNNAVTYDLVTLGTASDLSQQVCWAMNTANADVDRIEQKLHPMSMEAKTYAHSCDDIYLTNQPKINTHEVLHMW